MGKAGKVRRLSTQVLHRGARAGDASQAVDGGLEGERGPENTEPR